ncbi:PAB2, partial [Symbiodinium necroappetens]
DGEAVARRAIERFNGAWVDNRRIQLELDPNPPKSFLSCVFFHNVTWTTTAAELKRKFGGYGTVEEFELRVKPNGRSLGMGTCRFSCSKEAKNAIASLDGQMLHGRRLYLCRYDPIGAGRVQASRPWENCEPVGALSLKSESPRAYAGLRNADILLGVWGLDALLRCRSAEGAVSPLLLQVPRGYDASLWQWAGAADDEEELRVDEDGKLHGCSH